MRLHRGQVRRHSTVEERGVIGRPALVRRAVRGEVLAPHMAEEPGPSTSHCMLCWDPQLGQAHFAQLIFIDDEESDPILVDRESRDNDGHVPGLLS